MDGSAKDANLVFISHLKHISAQYIETSYHLSFEDPLYITAHNLIVSLHSTPCNPDSCYWSYQTSCL